MRRRPIACESLEPRRLLAVEAVQLDGIGYFIHPGQPRIERYDLAAETWLAPVDLAGATTAPTELAVGSAGLFVAFDKAVYRYAADGSARTHLLNASAAPQGLLLDGHLLFVNAASASPPNVTTIDTRTDTVVGSYSVWNVQSLDGASIAPGLNRIFGRTVGWRPDISSFDYGNDGVIKDGPDSPYHGYIPTASRTWVFPDQTQVVDDSGTVYRTADLRLATSLATRIDDVAFRADGTPVVLRGTTLVGYDAALLPATQVVLATDPDEILAGSDAVVTFTADPARPRGFREEVVPLTRFAPPPRRTPLDPVALAFVPESVATAADGTLLLFDSESASLFGWDPLTATYTMSVPLLGAPSHFAYSPVTDTAYVAEPSGLVRRIDLGVDEPVDVPFAALAAAPSGLAAAGAYLFTQDPTGYWSTYSTFAPDGTLVGSLPCIVESREFIWSEANQRMYFLDSNLSSLDINADGVSVPGGAPGGIGLHRSFPLVAGAEWQAPVRVAPDGSVVVLGSGMIHDAGSGTLALIGAALPNPITDATWLNSITEATWPAGDLYTLREVPGGTEVQHWQRRSFDFVAATTVPGTPVRLMTVGDRLVAITTDAAGVTVFHQFDGDLATVGPSPLTVSIGDALAIEGDAGPCTLRFTVTLSRPSVDPVLVGYRTVAGTAVVGRDYHGAAGFVTFQPGETVREVVVRGIGDARDEAHEQLSVVLHSPVGVDLGRSSATGTIVDDDLPPWLSVRDVYRYEGNDHDQVATFVLRLSAPSELPVSVNYRAISHTATAGEDFEPVSGTATFAPGRTVAIVRVPIHRDTTFENNERLWLDMDGVAHALLARSVAFAVIINDDVRPVVSVADRTLIEPLTAVTWAVFTVTLSAPAGVPVSVGYVTADGTARAGSDYAATSGRIVFAPGETTKQVYVAVLADAVAEPNESFALRLVAPFRARVEKAHAEATIMELAFASLWSGMGPGGKRLPPA